MQEPVEGGERGGGVLHVVEDYDGVGLWWGCGEGGEEERDVVGRGVEGGGELGEAGVAEIGGVSVEGGGAGAVRVDPD